MEERLTINLNSKPCYDIVLTDSFDLLNEEVSKLFDYKPRICLITDTNIDPIHSEAVISALSDFDVKKFVFEAGEKNKNLDTVKKAYIFLTENHFERRDLIVTLGGGVVGDVSGFIAATYLRGIKFMQIPTSLLAMCDSSIGGKTGVDFDGYKNIVGAFNMPKLVYINTSVLQTLPDNQYFNGFAEVMKSALIKNATFYEYLIDNIYEICEREPEAVNTIILESLKVKKLVVEKDPYEQGDRALLNFGHTLGHAIEKYMNFSLLHGECVALGSIAAAYISWKRDLLTMEEYYEIRDMFVPFNLPISIDNIDKEKIVEITKNDKKSSGGKVKFILLKKIGKAVICPDVTDDEMKAALDEITFTEEM